MKKKKKEKLCDFCLGCNNYGLIYLVRGGSQKKCQDFILDLDIFNKKICS
jgi:hypothetical protein